MLFGLLLLVGAALAAPATLLTKTTCKPSTTVNLNGPYSLPLTALADGQYCTYIFNVPAGSIAVASVVATDLNSTPQMGESVYFYDKFTTIDPVGSSGYTTYNETTAWGGQFQVNVQTYLNTQAKIQITVTLQKNLHGQNIAQTVSVATDGPSTVLYIADLQEGQTYQINAQTLANIKVAVGNFTDYEELNKIFIYDGGVQNGSLLTISRSQNFISTSRNVQLYVAKMPLGMKGGILLTDNSNVAEDYYHYVMYAPITAPNQASGCLLLGNDTAAGAVTMIGDKDGSTPITLTALSELDDNTAAFSYVSGGPLKTRANKEILLDPAQMPKKIPGNVNTYYIAKGMATIDYKI